MGPAVVRVASIFAPWTCMHYEYTVNMAVIILVILAEVNRRIHDGNSIGCKLVTGREHVVPVIVIAVRVDRHVPLVTGYATGNIGCTV